MSIKNQFKKGVAAATIVGATLLPLKGNSQNIEQTTDKTKSELVENNKINVENMSHEEISHIPIYKLDLETIKKHLLIEINRVRDSLGIKSDLKINEEISGHCQEFAEYLSTQKTTSHIDSEGKNLNSRLRHYGINFKNIASLGENLARTGKSIHFVVQIRLNHASDAHRRTLLYDGYSELGIGYHNRTWVTIYVMKYP